MSSSSHASSHASSLTRAVLPGVESAEKFVERLVDLLAQGQLKTAAAIYTSSQEDLGYPLLNAVKARNDRNNELMRRLAKVYAAARDYEKAARCCEDLEEHLAAAKLYERCGDYANAGEMFAKAGEMPTAAAMFLRAGDTARAIEVYAFIDDKQGLADAHERRGDIFETGRLKFELGDFAGAISHLQNVSAEDPNYLSACTLIAEILHRDQQAPLAIARPEGALATRPVDVETAPAYEAMARLLFADARYPEARNALMAVLAAQPTLTSARDLLREVEQVLRAGTSLRPETRTLVNQPAPTSDTAIAVDEVAVHEIEAIEYEAQILVAPRPRSDRGGLVGKLEGIEHLSAMPLLAELSLRELRQIHAISDRVTFAPGKLILEQGQAGEALFIVLEGEVDVLRRDMRGNFMPIARLGSGEHFGEMALIEHKVTTARVVAITQVTALRIAREPFQHVVHASDTLAAKIYRAFSVTLSERLRNILSDLQRDPRLI